MPRQLLCLFLLLLSINLAGQSFPAETIVCRQGSYLLSAPEGINGPSFQWERSFDGGASWTEISDANMANYAIAQPATGVSFRLRYAPGENCLADPSCASVTNATRIAVVIPEFFQSAVFCEGDSLAVGDEWLREAGNHVTVIDAGGCDSIVNTFVLLNPSYDLRFTATLCPGETFEGLSVQRDTVFSRSFSTVEGCDSTVTYELNLGFPEGLSIAGTTEACAGEQVNLSIPGQFASISWSTGQNSREIEVDQGGTYLATVTNSSGCSLELQHELRMVDLSAEAMTTDPLCAGAPNGAISIMATGDQDLLYSFDGGNSFSGGSERTGLSTGTYELLVESPGGCQWTGEVSLADGPDLNLTLNTDSIQSLERGDSVALRVTADFPVTTWRWNTLFGLSCADCPDPIARPMADTEYVLTALGDNGCSATVAVTFRVRDNRRFYVPNAFEPDQDGQNDYFQIYPGPRTTGVEAFTIVDRWGGTLYRQNESLPPGDDRLRWDGNSKGQPLQTGTYGYFARLWFSDGSSRVVSGTVNLIR